MDRSRYYDSRMVECRPLPTVPQLIAAMERFAAKAVPIIVDEAMALSEEGPLPGSISWFVARQKPPR